MCEYRTLSKFILFVILFFLCQGSDVSPWSEVLSTSDSFMLRKAIEDIDGNIIAVGIVVGSYRPIIMKIGIDGNVIFARTYAMDYFENQQMVMNDVLVASDGNIYSFGTGYQNGNFRVGLVLSVDPTTGSVVDIKRYYDNTANPNKRDAAFKGVLDVGNGYYIIHGARLTGGTWSGIVMNVTIPGFQVQWQKAIGNTNTQQFYRMAKVPSGGFVTVGFNSPGDEHVIITRLDQQGNLVWMNYYNNARGEWGRGIDVYGSEILACSDYAVMKVDLLTGRTVSWSKKLLPAGTIGDAIQDCKFTESGDVIVTGGLGGISRPVLVIIKSDGSSIIGASRFLASSSGNVADITVLKDSYLIAGYLDDDGTVQTTQGKDGLLLEIKKGESLMCGGLNYAGLSMEDHVVSGITVIGAASAELSSEFEFLDIYGWINQVSNIKGQTTEEKFCWSCNSVIVNEANFEDSLGCRGVGDCMKDGTCFCLNGVYSNQSKFAQDCDYDCNGVPFENEDACSGSPFICSGPDNCTCPPSVPPNECWFCYGNYWNDSDVCSPRPNAFCASQDNCTCLPGYFDPPSFLGLDELCSHWECEGRLNTDANVCNGPGYGRCDAPGDCVCSPHIFGPHCTVSTCGNYMSNQTGRVCHNHGDCNVIDQTCACDAGYLPDTYCLNYTCFGFLPNDTDKVCSNHGKCIGGNDCLCAKNYTNATDCSTWSCYGVDSESEDTCSEHGVCQNYDDCDCWSSEYQGVDCGEWTCFGISLKADSSLVCGGHGFCIQHDTCSCLPGYYAKNIIKGGNCSEWSCGVYDKEDEQNVCNSRGDCVASHSCVCHSVDLKEYEGQNKVYFVAGGNSKYEGQLCETYSCGLPHDSPLTCNGNGKCLAPNVCECQTGYKDELCSTNTLYTTVLVPVLSSTGGIIVLIILGLGSCAVCVCCVCVCCVMILLVGLAGLGVLFGLQKIRLRKFGKLKDVDLLIMEQQREDDNSVAHIRINKSLFEIPFDEIKTEKVLGEGGSQSVVFKAKWRSLVVAFKCFKTRNLCNSQDDFDEFEKEVQILSSLSHPNVIRFYGACMKVPRVGIIMEYCGEGEIMIFYQKYKERNGNNIEYPINERIRQAGEIVSALSYCHSRNVIHRDLKCENVLVDEKENAKLMDFGLSKAVDNMGNSQKSVGTSMYMAPEVVTDESYDSMCDVYSFSIMLFVILTGNEHPYGKNEYRIEFKVASNPLYRPDLSELDKCLNNEKSLKWIKYIIKRCWNSQPKYRLDFPKIFELFEEHLENVDHSKKCKKRDGDGADYAEDTSKEEERHGDLEGVGKMLKEMESFENVKLENEDLRNKNEEMKMEILDLKEKISKLMKK